MSIYKLLSCTNDDPHDFLFFSFGSNFSDKVIKSFFTTIFNYASILNNNSASLDDDAQLLIQRTTGLFSHVCIT